MFRIPSLLWLPLLLLVQMCQVDQQISPEIMDKLDARLQSLVQHSEGEPAGLSPVSHNDDGDPVYSVVVHTEDAGNLRDAGLRLNAVIGSIATARWTRQDILRAASLESTLRIESDSELNFPENQQTN